MVTLPRECVNLPSLIACHLRDDMCRGAEAINPPTSGFAGLCQ